MNAHAKILSAHPSFSTLSARNLGRLTEKSKILEMPKGSLVYQEGEPGDALFLLLTGRCQSVVVLPDGAVQVLNIYSPGDTFGERALMSQDRHWTTVQVITDSVVLRLDGDDVHKLMDREPRLAKQLVNRLREHMRSLSEEVDTLRAELGRVVAVSCLSDQIHGPMIAENLSHALCKETAASVLFVRVLPGNESPRLLDWEPPSPTRNGGFRYAADLIPGKGGLQHLGLFAGGGEAECRRVASLIGHMARYFRYVVISTERELDGTVMEEFQRQSDFSYVLFGQSPEELYRTNMFLREIRGLLESSPSQIRPVVCLKVGDRCRPFEELRERLGAGVHAVIRGLPESRSASETHSHYLIKPDDRFSANIRYLAREIGRCRVGIALSSGGAKGFAHIGVLQVLEENGIHVDVIAGASMGAYLGSLRAYGLTGQELGELAMEMSGRFGLLRIMDPIIPPRRGFMKGGKARRLLEKTIGDAHFSDMMLQMRIIATDLETLERVVFDTGQVSTAVQASMAMPGVVVPVAREGRILVDGGTAEPLPVNTLIEMGVERIIASNTIPNPDEMKRQAMSDREAAASPAEHHHLFPSLKHYLNYFDEGNILDIVMRSMHALQTRVVEGACKQADVVLRPFLYDGKWHDFGRPERYLEHGRRVAEQQLPELLELAEPSGLPVPSPPKPA